MKITAIKQQIKNPDRVSIFVEGKYSFSLSLDELLEQKLRSGIEIDEQRLKSLKKISLDGKLRNRTLEWVLSRPRSERELKDYLKRKKAEPELSERIVSEMQLRGYQNDIVFARWFSEVRIRRGKSNRAVLNELRSKGIKSDVIKELLYSDNTEKSRLIAIYEKKKNISRYKDPVKLTRYLVGLGFPYELVKEVLDAG